LKIGDIADVVRGSSPRPQGDARYYGGPIPRLMVADLTRDGKNVTPQIDSLTLQGAEMSRPMKKGDLVIAVSGNPGLPAILAIDACIHDGFVGLRNLDSTRVNIDYLYRFLLYEKIRTSGQAVGAIFKNLTSDQVREIELPLPPLPEQKRIAAILDKADSIRRKRQEAVRLTEELLCSVFLDMFGDPVTNPTGWDICTVGSFLINVTNGLTRRRKEVEIGKDIVLRLRDVREGWIDYRNLNRITLTQEESSRFKVEVGNLLFIRVNGNPDYVGRCAIFDGFSEDVFFNDHIMCVKPDYSKVNGIYLVQVLNGIRGKQEIAQHRKTSAGQHTINQQGLSKVTIPVPPLDLQEKFERRVRKITKLSYKFINSTLELETLFNSLLQRAFIGDQMK